MEYLTKERLEHRQGEAFFLGYRLERLYTLVGSVMSTDRDFVLVSGHDGPPVVVRGGKVLGMQVFVSWAVPAGEVWMWSDSERRVLA